MQSYLKLIGNGQKSARYFTQQEAATVMTLLLTQQASPAQIGALMAILRFKEETVEELIGFTQSLRQQVDSMAADLPYMVEIGTPYDGRSKAPSLLVAAACMAAACGVRVALHGRQGHNTSPKFGAGVGDILQELKVPPCLSLAHAKTLLEDDQIGLTYVDSTQMAPVLERFNSLRVEYGMRSFFNTIEKLLSPFQSPNVIVGVFHGGYMDRMAQALQGLGYQRGLVIQGTEGAVDILPSRRTPVIEVSPTACQTWQLDPHELGGWDKTEDDELTWDAQKMAELNQALLMPKLEQETLRIYQRGAVLTAALFIYASAKVTVFAEGLTIAEAALASGAAQARLVNLQKVSQKLIY